jgi:hypothetical protein
MSTARDNYLDLFAADVVEMNRARPHALTGYARNNADLAQAWLDYARPAPTPLTATPLFWECGRCGTEIYLESDHPAEIRDGEPLFADFAARYGTLRCGSDGEGGSTWHYVNAYPMGGHGTPVEIDQIVIR